MELLGNNPSIQDLIEKLNEVIGSLNNSLPNTDSEIAEVKKLVSFGSGVLAGRLNAKLWYFKTQELMTASTELCEGDSCFVLKDGVTTGEGTFEYWYIYKTSDVVDIIDSYVDLSNPDLVAVKLQDMTLKDVKDTLSAQISDQSKDLNTKISNLRTDIETALSGKADLVNGLISASQLPSYVDDIIESWLEDTEFPENAYAKEDTEMTIPLTPEFSKIYVNLLNNKTYRWGGSFYVEVSKSLAIGETATTAFSGNRGVQLEEKIKYLENYVTPEMFGAVGDGIADDTNAFQYAIDECKNNSKKLFAFGKYKLSNSVIIENVSVYVYGIIYNASELPCIIISNTNSCDFYINKIINNTPAYKPISGNSINYSIGILLKNCTDCKVLSNRIQNFVSGLVIASTNGIGSYYNVVDIKSFESCFNGIRFLSVDEEDSVNGNIVNYAKFDFHTWNTDDKPYCIMIDSFASSGTPYHNNSNYFNNLFVEYGVDGTRYPRLIKSNYGDNNSFDFKRIEIAYRDEGTNNISDAFEFSENVRNNKIHILFSWRQFIFDNRNTLGNILVVEQGIFGVYDRVGNRLIDITNELTSDVDGLTIEFKKATLDILTGLVVVSCTMHCSSDIPASTVLLKNLPVSSTSEILCFPLSKGSIWNKPTEGVGLYHQGKELKCNHQIDYNSHFAINYSYYTKY